MRIVAATFTARDPAGLRRWYDERVGAEQPRFTAGPEAVHHFAFHVAEPAHDRLELTDEYEFSAWGGARARYFHDPEGNVGELIARPHPRPELSLAEVGLPVPDVAEVVAALRGLGVEPYREGGEDFAPLGDDDGLLIVVQEGRSWFPTGERAGAAPVTVTIEGVRPGEVLLPGAGHRVVSI